MQKNYRSRKHCFLLYPNEDITHKNALEYIKLNYDYAFIVHDKDINDQGELKKQHTHVVVSFNNAKWNTAIAKELGIEPNYMQECRNFERALDYLIHFNDDTKYQYSIDEVIGPLKSKLEKIISNDGKSEDDKAIEIFDFIDNFKGKLTVSAVGRYSASVGMWDVFRRASSIYLNAISEHNLNVITSDKIANETLRRKSLINHQNTTSDNIYYVN